MAKKRRKLSPELEKNISLAKKQIELITAIIHDIDEDDIQEEYKSAFLPVMSTYMSLDQMYKEVGFNDDTSNLYQLYLSNLDKFKNMTEEEIFNERKNKYLKIGRNKGFIDNTNELSSLKPEKNKLSQILIEKKIVSVSLVLALIALLLFITL